MLHTLSPLKSFRSCIDYKVLAPDVRSIWLQVARSNHWSPLVKEITELARSVMSPLHVDCSGRYIDVQGVSESSLAHIESLCKRLIPWRIGPYKVGALTIDSEWRSEAKWSRLEPLLGPLEGLRVADVGCSSGYFLFKLASLHPELVVGFDPIERCWFQFALLQAFAQLRNVAFLPTGVATVDAFPGFFDLVLCMGVIYHQRDPFTACKKLYSAVKPGGRVILESLVIPQSGSHLLVPTERYARMRNAWIIPTSEALATLLVRAGFTQPQIHQFGPVTTAEQRATEWAPYKSLRDFLDPLDETKTVEGYPAPHSALVIAVKN